MRFGTKYSRMDHVKFFKGCRSQISLGPFLNGLSHLQNFNKVGQNNISVVSCRRKKRVVRGRRC